jgi:RNase P subunit RPR2
MNLDSLSKEKFNEFIDDYYNSEESVTKVLKNYGLNISARDVVKYLPDVITENFCEYCNINMHHKASSRTSFKDGYSVDIFCKECGHTLHRFSYKSCTCGNCVRKQDNLKQDKEKLNLESLKHLIQVAEANAIDTEELSYLSLTQKTYLLTLLMYLYDEIDHSFKSINTLDGIKFAPTQKYGFSIITNLIGDLIKFKINQDTLDGIILNEDGNYSYAPYQSSYKLNIKDSKSFNYSEIVKYCEYIYSNNVNESKEEAVTLWKEIGFYELKEYLYYLFEKYNFDTDYIGDAIIEKLELILEDFSISQGFAILYSSVTGAASYKQTGIPNKRAVNSINTYISNNIAKRKSGEWQTKGYKRNFDLPQTAVSIVFFNNIIKIGEKGFEQVPRIENIPDDFIDFFEEINFEKTISKSMSDDRKRILNTFDLLTKEQYSFGEVLEIMIREFKSEDKILRQLDDSEILQKLINIEERIIEF